MTHEAISEDGIHLFHLIGDLIAASTLYLEQSSLLLSRDISGDII